MAELRKQLGAYYTPEWLAKPLVRWALREGVGPILDPSFGGCALLRAALDELRSSAGRKGARLVFGYDVDRTAKKYADELIAAGVPRENLFFRNFLSSDPSDRTYRAIVGNPPYVRHHLLSLEEVARAQRAMRRAGVHLPRVASSWAYFVVHSAEHLEHGGRMILLLPGAVLHAAYARPVIEYLVSRFALVQFVHVADRLFQSAQEETVVLLADNFGGSCTREQHVYGADSQRLAQMLDGDALVPQGEGNQWKFPLISRLAKEVFDAVHMNVEAHLSDLAVVRLGVVTGANNFFVRRTDDPVFSKGHATSVAITTSSATFESAIWRSSDQQRIQKQGRPSRLLLIRRRLSARDKLLRDVKRAEREGLHRRYWCGKRDPWYILDDIEPPDAFMPYMAAYPIPFTMNKTRTTCTNAVHRIWFKKNDDGARVVFSSWTSIHSLASELFGRNYGGGILKMEPSCARQMPIVCDAALADVEKLDAIARAKGRHAARDFADKVLCKALGLGPDDILAVREAAEILGKRRRKSLNISS